jgi:hypothetical protein
LVPRDIYFQAVAASCREDGESEASAPITPDGFDNWLGIQKPSVKTNIFGRQIQDWLADTLAGPIPPKHKIMEKAVELCPPDKIALDKFRELLKEIRESLDGKPTEYPD